MELWPFRDRRGQWTSWPYFLSYLQLFLQVLEAKLLLSNFCPIIWLVDFNCKFSGAGLICLCTVPVVLIWVSRYYHTRNDM